jgi:hypothetical protein
MLGQQLNVTCIYDIDNKEVMVIVPCVCRGFMAASQDPTQKPDGTFSEGTLPKAAESYSTREPIEGFLSCFDIRGCILMGFGVAVGK